MSEYRILSGSNPEDYPSNRVAVAMSGGVDSSLSALVLKDAGFDVIGLTMLIRGCDNCGEDGQNDAPGGSSAVDDAKSVAQAINIPHHTVDMRDTFEHRIVRDFVGEYLSGRTPNPCVRCNALIKWGALFDSARELGCDLIATGHYTRIGRYGDGTFSLIRGFDTTKEQSYFLWSLGSESLARTLFPLGGTTKEQTRREAERRALPTRHRAESQEICFIPDDDYGRFLRERFSDSLPVPLTEGDILTVSGKPVGRHRGAAYYTIGQRRGLGLAMGHPVYVTAVDTQANTVTVGENDDLLSSAMTVGDIAWTRGFPPSDVFRCSTRIRYRHPGASSEVRVDGSAAVVTFDEPQRAVTPGQSAVFYDGDVVLGGGVIEMGIRQ